MLNTNPPDTLPFYFRSQFIFALSGPPRANAGPVIVSYSASPTVHNRIPVSDAPVTDVKSDELSSI